MTDVQLPALPREPAGPAEAGNGAAARTSLVGRAFGLWRQVLREMASGARLPFLGGADPDLADEHADRLRAQMRECLEARGSEVLTRAQAANIASAYLALSPTGRARFFRILAHEFGIDRDAVRAAMDELRAAPDEAARLTAERALRRRLVSPGMRLLTKFNALPDGLRFLIDLRADLLNLKDDDPALEALDQDFRHLLATWFDIGFLSRQRLTWDSPASLLEKIVEYEAVHEIRSWTDLRHRLDGDRRCYAFFHPSLPREPLIFVQVALVEGLAGAIEPLLDERRPPLDPKTADTAIFYSITNTLLGLRGISFGNFLIKQVVDDLARDCPNLKQFATLSPMPGFRDWLRRQDRGALLSEDQWAALAGMASSVPELAVALGEPGWLADEDLRAILEGPLTRAAARYLVERGRDGAPVDPVARFHLGNGARIERVNWAADATPRRLQQSCGLMVNYLYHRPEIEPNHEAFASRKVVAVSPPIADLLKDAPEASRSLFKVSRRGSGLTRMIGRA